MESAKPDFVFFKKLVIFGSSESGKSTFISLLDGESFTDDYIETGNMLNFKRLSTNTSKQKELHLDTFEVNISENNLPMLDSNFLENILYQCQCALFFLDYSKEKSFYELKKFSSILSQTEKLNYLSKIIVLNKKDLSDSGEITKAQVEEYIKETKKEHNYSLFEISLKDNSFKKLVDKIYENVTKNKKMIVNMISELENISVKKTKLEISLEYSLSLLGDTTVGKTAFLNRYCKGTFNENYLSTIGVGKELKYLQLNGERLRLTIWDTAGQERFRSLPKNYYQNVEGILLMFDLTSTQSFQSISSNWIKEINLNTKKENCPIIYLIGNKLDLMDRKVPRQAAKSVAKENNMKYFEVSAKNNINIIEIIDEMIMDCYSKSHKGVNVFSLDNSNEKKNHKQKCC